MVAVPSPEVTATTRVDDAAAARRGAQVSDLAPDLVRLALVVTVDALFLVGVLLPYLDDAQFPNESLPDVLGVLVLLTPFFLPWVTFGSAAFSGYLLWRGPSGPLLLGIRLGVVVLALAGLVTYFSPWGVDAIRWLMD